MNLIAPGATPRITRNVGPDPEGVELTCGIICSTGSTLSGSAAFCGPSRGRCPRLLLRPFQGQSRASNPAFRPDCVEEKASSLRRETSRRRENTMAILVTGGAGYIGSVTTELLRARGEQVVVLDNLSRGHRAAVAPEVPFCEGNVGDRELVARIAWEHSVDACIHFAAFAYVGESVSQWFSHWWYYRSHYCLRWFIPGDWVLPMPVPGQSLQLKDNHN